MIKLAWKKISNLIVVCSPFDSMGIKKGSDLKEAEQEIRKQHHFFSTKIQNQGCHFYLLAWATILLVLQLYLHISSLWLEDQEAFVQGTFSASKVKHALKALDEKLSPNHHARRATAFNIEIFSAPKPFIASDREVNLRAIRSWQRLVPRPKITLLGDDIGYSEVAAEYGLHIRRDVDKTFLGVPLFNSMFHVANQSKATVAVIMNGDIVLLGDFVHTLKRILTRFENFLMISARYDLEEVPDDAQEGSNNYDAIMQNYALRHGTLHTYGGMDLWAWNPSGPRLFDGQMPHFIFGRGKYDNWLTHETIVAGRRHVIDASEAVMSIHIRHGYNLVSQSQRSLLSESEGRFWSQGKKSKFELFINIYLSLHTGSYRNQMGNILSAPWRLARCLEPGGSCFVKRLRPGACNCEYSVSSVATQTDASVVKGSRVIQCGIVSQEMEEDYEIPSEASAKYTTEPASFGMPLTLKSATEKLAINKTMIVTALNFGYKDIMMNWVCNLRHLSITNFVIAAFDNELYEFGYTRGLPIYLETEVTGRYNTSLTDATYGTSSFKELTKMKSRIVLRFLKLGYNVVWSDADVVWFRNPLVDLWAHKADLVIQTNAPDNEEANANRRINSGFYLAIANEKVINGFERVIRYAAKSRMSEQPCFYDVLCGKEGERRVGNNECLFEGMRVRLLDRDSYPNGITGGIWDVEDGKITERFPEVIVLHNNWVKGTVAKLERYVRHGFVMYDVQSGLCRYPRF